MILLAKPRFRAVLPKAALAAALWLVAGPVLAHEHRLVGPNGQYAVTVGWYFEPAFVDAVNAVDIFIIRAADNKPVDTSKGDVVDLEVEVQYRAAEDEKSAVLEAAKLDSKPELAVHTENRYNAWFKPTRTGAYAFHIKGKVSDASNPKAGPVTIDETYVCGKGSRGHHAFVCLSSPQIFPAARTKSR
jgi:hypothetical protein